MTVPEIRRIGVVGLGAMGSGIAQVMAAAGYEVVLRDISDAFVAKGMAAIAKNLAGGVAKGSLLTVALASHCRAWK